MSRGMGRVAKGPGRGGDTEKCFIPFGFSGKTPYFCTRFRRKFFIIFTSN